MRASDRRGRVASAIGAAAVVALSACGGPVTAPPVPSSAASTSSTGAPATVPGTIPATTLPATTAPAITVPTGPLPVGPGTLTRYAVQAQPAPGACHYRWVGVDPLPDPSCTPGATNPQVTQADIGTTICATGWTASVRPPEGVTGPEKQGSAAAYGYTGPWGTAEYDHLVPLELGGDPNDPANLWLEPNDRPGATTYANGKDVLENRLRELVCSGAVPLDEAQRAIATDWVAALQHYGS